MGESQYLNEVRARTRAETELRVQRKALLAVVDSKFRGQVEPEVRHLIEGQESLPLIDDWFQAALAHSAYADFRAVVCR